jgi:hypothetical protein
MAQKNKNGTTNPTTRRLLLMVTLLVLICGIPAPSSSQANPELQVYFKEYIGLSDDEIAAIRNGQAIAKTLHSRTPAEIFVFGAVHINGTPESYLKLARDFDRLRKLPGYLAIQEFSNPPQLSDLADFRFEKEDIEALKDCKPGDCKIQMPASSIEELHHSVDLSAPDAEEQVDQVLQKTVLERLFAYQRAGNQMLGVYNDKKNPTEVPEQFKYMLSYAKALPKYLPDFYNYLLTFPDGKPADVTDTFYWDKVKFGLKPTLRVVQVLTLRGSAGGGPVYVVAEKQLYSSHYFETALDLTFCVPDTADSKQPGFYLIMAMGSEQAGLTGFKGSIVRHVAEGRSASSLQKSLTVIKNTLESAAKTRENAAGARRPGGFSDSTNHDGRLTDNGAR